MKRVPCVLNTVKIDERHTSINLAKELRKIVADWNLTNKISAVVTDNAANIKTNVIKNGNFNTFIL
jgi:hypothetical protein